MCIANLSHPIQVPRTPHLTPLLNNYAPLRPPPPPKHVGTAEATPNILIYVSKITRLQRRCMPQSVIKTGLERAQEMAICDGSHMMRGTKRSPTVCLVQPHLIFDKVVWFWPIGVILAISNTPRLCFSQPCPSRDWIVSANIRLTDGLITSVCPFHSISVSFLENSLSRIDRGIFLGLSLATCVP